MEASFFQRNRQAFMTASEAEAAAFAGNILVQRSNDAAFAFEQEANFWYLTGIDSPAWQVVIEKHKTTLIAPDVDEVHRIFDGSLSDEDALHISGADAVVPFAEGQKLLEELSRAYDDIFSLGDDPHASHYDFALNPGPIAFRVVLAEHFKTVRDCRLELAKLRAIKTPEEIQAIRDAIRLTSEAFKLVKTNMASYELEYAIEAAFSNHFRLNGATGHAYDPIVAAGKNACTLHYGKNQAQLEKGQFVLLDIGARLNGYPADITRTYAYGDVSERHKAVHEAVENAHHEIIALLRPGYPIKDYFDKVDRIMLRTLHGLGLLKEKQDYRKYFPHSISHGLGIDVHDALGAPEAFKPGMILTVEPGIYIPEEGIGVRIEDDILITKVGHENLSADLPTSL